MNVHRKAVYLFRGVELEVHATGMSAKVGPVFVTLFSVVSDGTTWHHASATWLDAETGGRVHAQAKDPQRGPALLKLESLVGRFAEWGNGVLAAKRGPFNRATEAILGPERDADESDAAKPPGWDLTP